MRYFKVYAAEILSDRQFAQMTAQEIGVWVRIMAYITRNGTCGYLVSNSTGEPMPFTELSKEWSGFLQKSDQNVTRTVRKIDRIVNRFLQIGIFNFRKDGAFGCPAWHKLYSEYERNKLSREAETIARLNPKTPDTDTPNVLTLNNINPKLKTKDYYTKAKDVNNIKAVIAIKDVGKREPAGDAKVVSNSGKTAPHVTRLTHGIPKTTALQMLDQLWAPQDDSFQPLRERLINLLDQFSPETQLRGMLQFKSRVTSKDMPERPYSFLKAIMVRIQTEEDTQLQKRRKDVARMIASGVIFSKCCGQASAQVEYLGTSYSVCPGCNSVITPTGQSTGKDVHGDILGDEDKGEKFDGSPL